MKKLMMTFAAVLCCAMISTVFTACSKSDDNNTNPADDKTPAAAVMDFSLTVGDDMIDKLNLSVEYYDANGNVQTEALTSKEWKKSVKSSSLPATLGARLMVKAKDGIDYATLTKITESYSYAYEIYPVNASGIMLDGGKGGSSHLSLDVPGDKVAEWIADKSSGIVKVLYTINASGKVESAKWQ